MGEMALTETPANPMQEGMALAAEVDSLDSTVASAAEDTDTVDQPALETASPQEPVGYQPRGLDDLRTAAREQVRRFSRPIRVVALAVSALALAACTSKGADAEPSDTANQVRDAVVRQIDADVQARVEANAELLDVIGAPSRAGEFQEYLEGQPADDQAKMADLEQVVELAKGSDVVADILDDSETEEELAAEKAEVANPHIQRLVEKAEDYKEAEDILDGPEGVVLAEPEEYPALKAELAQVEKSTRDKAMSSLEGHFALDVVEKVGYGNLSQAQALKMIGFIRDKGLRDQVAKTIEMVAKDQAAQADYDGDSYRYYDEAEELRDALEDRVEAADKAMDGLKDGITAEAGKLTEKIEDIYDASEAKVEATLAQNASGLEPLPINTDTVKQPSDPTQSIDFSSLKISEMIPNDAKPFVDHDKNDIMREDKLPQFAEVYVENGVMKFRVAEDSGLAPQSQQAMEQVLDNLSPLVVEAFRAGKLNGIHFVMVDSEDQFNGSYGPSRDAYVLVPKTHMTVQALQLVVSHEVIGHGLTEDAITQAEDGSEDAQAISRVCSAVRSTVHKRLETSLELSSDRLDALAAVVDPGYQVTLLELKRIVQHGGLLHKELTEDLGVEKYAGARFNDCIGMSLQGALNDVAYSAGVKLPEGQTFSEMYGALPQYEDLLSVWNTAVNTNTIYGYLNESNYTDNLNAYEAGMGHSDDNVSELTASVVNVAIHYPDQMVDTVLGLPAPEQAGTVAALRLAMTLAGKDASPEAQAFFEERFQHIVNEVSDRTPAGN